MKVFRAELHVHTVLSPCAEVEMIPPLIVSEALARGINLIAITDHNATANIRAVQEAAAGSDLTVLPGMELQTREEVHVLCLFDHLSQAEELQRIVEASLPVLENRPDYFGEQFVVDRTGDFLRREERLLLTSTKMNLKEAWEAVEKLGGMVIPAHVNRTGFGLLPTLGFIPPDVPIEVVEISRHLRPEDAGRSFPQLASLQLIQSGDVHRLDEYLGVNEFILEQPSIGELRQAFRSEQGRSFRLLPLI